MSSFDLSAIGVVREAKPSIVTGWLTPSWSDAMVALATTVERGHRALHPRHEGVTDALLGAAREAGVDINTWTVDDPVRIRQLSLAGVHALITNVPDVARTALAAST
ncbi:MAG TPA: glycerophosphodiester phosphodiesterase [Acidimicrobiales bacterium]|nr:glycerophosphodiester phosphodiesterase [Acidimicrobiales bacterium]